MLAIDLLAAEGISPERFCLLPSGTLLYALAGSETWEAAAHFVRGSWLSETGLPCSPVVIRCDEPLLAILGEEVVSSSEEGYEFFNFNHRPQRLHLHRPRGRRNVCVSDGVHWQTVSNPLAPTKRIVLEDGLPLLLYPLSLHERLAVGPPFSWLPPSALGPRSRLSLLAEAGLT